MQVIHIVYPITDEPLSVLDLRTAIHNGAVEQVADEIQNAIEAQGYEITRQGGDWGHGDGHCSALTWRVPVTLEDGYSVTWQHLVRESGEQWTRKPTLRPEGE